MSRSGSVSIERRASPTLTESASSGVKPSSLLGDLEHPRVELEDDLSRTGARRLEVAREGEPAATEVEDVDRPAEPVEVRARRVGEALDIAEPDDGRIGHVDVGVGEPVEDEGPPVHVVAVGHDRDAVVGALRVAGRGTGERETAHGDRGEGEGPGPGLAAAPQGYRQRQPDRRRAGRRPRR